MNPKGSVLMQVQEILTRLPESTKEYIVTLLVCPSHRVDKNRKLARNVIVGYVNCTPDAATEACDTLLQLAEGCDKWELREKWQEAFHDINTKPLGTRSHATGHRFI
jgi:hypothetical protein